jgi:hypothetical protein
MWSITRIDLSVNQQSHRRYVLLYVEACLRRTEIILGVTGTRFDWDQI